MPETRKFISIYFSYCFLHTPLLFLLLNFGIGIESLIYNVSVISVEIMFMNALCAFQIHSALIFSRISYSLHPHFFLYKFICSPLIQKVNWRLIKSVFKEWVVVMRSENNFLCHKFCLWLMTWINCFEYIFKGSYWGFFLFGGKVQLLNCPCVT